MFLRRLHMQFYIAIVGTLVAFLACGAVVWHYFSAPRGAIWGVESATGLAATLLTEPDGGRDRELAEALGNQLHAHVVLLDAAGVAQISTGRVPDMSREESRDRGWVFTQDGPVFTRKLADGRRLIVYPRRRFLMHGLHMGLVLVGIAVTLALLTYPISRGIAARLARLQEGVRQFGGGNLAARVAVEGRDEVAALATSFNESAHRIEELVESHQLLLAHCSHELRTPLARIRMAMEKLPALDSPSGAELTRNIAELDALIGEMLLSSRLDASRGLERTEAIDLLALCAEEASWFDREVTGEALIVRGEPWMLRCLVRNLLENARIHGGGATAVFIERARNTARLCVEDGGTGVAEIDRARIFEPFQRATAAGGATGVGLGLSIVRQIAHAHGGAVAYEERDAGGSRFIVTVPLL
ncbi:MAG: HAMP domain-containing protein [Steroidobacteraceae bacterium]|nr:HAMP domain-containing protein [Steroidobacteraceae bacterium]